MNKIHGARYRLLAVMVSALVLISPFEPAFGQPLEGTATTITVDVPTQGQGVTTGQQIDIGGWAIDRIGPGTGVDGVQVFLDGPMGQGTRLGAADYRRARPDVATALGNSELLNSGFDLLWTVAELSPGRHTLYVYAQSLSAGWVYKTVDVTVVSAPTPTPSRAPTSPGGSGGPYEGDGPQYPPFPISGYCPPYGAGYGWGWLGYGGGYCATVGYPVDPLSAPPGLTLAPGSAAIQPPTGVTATAIPPATVRLTWTPSPSPGVTTYLVRQSGRAFAYAPAPSAFVPAVVSNLTNTGATISGLTPSPPCHGYGVCYYPEYTFQVIAVGPAGIQSTPATSNSVSMPGGYLYH